MTEHIIKNEHSVSDLFLRKPITTLNGKTMSENALTEPEAVLQLLYKAQTLLLNQLHTPKLVTIELAEGIDKLFQAYELVKNPDTNLPACPICKNLFYGESDTYKHQCLSCGKKLQKQ
jgi:hypothetical protein